MLHSCLISEEVDDDDNQKENISTTMNHQINLLCCQNNTHEINRISTSAVSRNNLSSPRIN